MSTNYEKLKKLLRELFQFDQADLDFGIYRIMNFKRKEIEKFLEEDLLPQVKQTLESIVPVKKKELDQELQKAIENARALGVDPESTEKVKELREEYKKIPDSSAIEPEIYGHLYNFFKRYYSEGDFISKRRYKKDVYAIPYEGEEVKLHWANADQYYIKTTEHFKNYTFILPKSRRKVHFKLVDATTEKDNNKSQEGKGRFFVLSEQGMYEDSGELYIPFEYKELSGRKKQEKINEETIKALEKTEGFEHWLEELKTPSPTEKNPGRTLLEKHLSRYTSKNKFDYFIHKDLGGFLRRELDFYIKNEIMNLDDLNTENELQFQQYLSKVKVIKEIGHKIIQFLEQIENFQKKLWLKKKFVIETNYCITLDRVPEEFYSEILKNEDQIEEWKELYAIEEIEGDTTRAGYSDPLTEEFLRTNPYLVVDTKFFDEDLKQKLISRLSENHPLDEQIDGLLIHSENFQALNLIRNKYRKSIKTIYIDPPYNTVHSEILYKNNFKHSSWLSLMANCKELINNLFEDMFSFGISIDDYEFVNLAAQYDSLFPNLEREVVVINHHPQGSGGRLSRTHEYLILYSPSNAPQYLGKPLSNYQEKRNFMRSGTAENNFRSGRWKSFYALLLDPANNKIVDAEPPVPLGKKYPHGKNHKGLKRIYPINSKGEERVWRSSYETGKKRALNGELIISDNGTVYQKIDHENKREVLFSNWTDSKYNAGVHGTNLLKDMGLGQTFDYPKSIHTLETALWAQTFGDSKSIILDYFAGSGTTAHAVINLNREDKGKRKYILVEMGEYFDTVTKPRIKKVMHSKDWKDGKPVSREGSSHMFKYIRLESYEDTLNNLELDRSEHMNDLFKQNQKFYEEYMLSYMLDTETKESPSLLNIKEFKNPFNYRIKIIENNEPEESTVDLVETFNYLIGLYVERYGKREYFTAKADEESQTPGAVKLIKSKEPTPISFMEVEGQTNDGKKVLVIWRTLTGETDIDNAALDAYFAKRDYNTLDFEFDRIYVNGNNNLENLKTGEQQWKVNLIEEEFKKRMFDVQD